MPSSRSAASLVYALEAADSNHSYVGVTNNFARRLREHNGVVKGRGARYTRRSSEWRPVFRVTGLPTRRQALQLEKLMHSRRSLRLPTMTKERNPFGATAAARRAWQLYLALKRERFSQRRTMPTRALKLRIEWGRLDFYKIASKRLRDWGPGTVTHVHHRR